MADPLIRAINDRHACARCGASGTWLRAARRDKRLNSTIQRLRCGHCGEGLVAKVVYDNQADADALGRSLRREYDALCDLAAVFPADSGLGVLVPQGFFEANGCRVMLTRLFDGSPLQIGARVLDHEELSNAFRKAGAWLRVLHRVAHSPGRVGSAGLADRLAYLDQRYGVYLRSRATLRDAQRFLAATATGLASQSFRLVGLHGDFKPDNVLIRWPECVGLDIHLTDAGVPAYDIAPFLNHLWLDGVGGRGALGWQRCDAAELAFLEGYGDVGDHRVLRWLQLYFLLCHAGTWCRRGRMFWWYSRGPLLALLNRGVTRLRDAMRQVEPC